MSAIGRYLETVEGMGPDEVLRARIERLRELSLGVHPPEPYQPGMASEASVQAMESSREGNPATEVS